jgi:hypothetical protein
LLTDFQISSLSYANQTEIKSMKAYVFFRLLCTISDEGSHILSELGLPRSSKTDLKNSTPSIPPAVTPSVPPAVIPSVPPAVIPSVPPAVTPSIPPAVTPSL